MRKTHIIGQGWDYAVFIEIIAACIRAEEGFGGEARDKTSITSMLRYGAS